MSEEGMAVEDRALGIRRDELPDPLAKLPALAQRLGVKPVGEGAKPSVVLNMRDGTSYDLFDLIGAALDRLDTARPSAAE